MQLSWKGGHFLPKSDPTVFRGVIYHLITLNIHFSEYTDGAKSSCRYRVSLHPAGPGDGGQCSPRGTGAAHGQRPAPTKQPKIRSAQQYSSEDQSGWPISALEPRLQHFHSTSRYFEPVINIGQWPSTLLLLSSPNFEFWSNLWFNKVSLVNITDFRRGRISPKYNH